MREGQAGRQRGQQERAGVESAWADSGLPTQPDDPPGVAGESGRPGERRAVTLRRLEMALSNRQLRPLLFVLLVVLVAALAQAMATWGINKVWAALLYGLTILLGLWVFWFRPANPTREKTRRQKLKEMWPLFALLGLGVIVLAQSMAVLVMKSNETLILLLLVAAVGMWAMWPRSPGDTGRGEARRLTSAIALLLAFATTLAGSLRLAGDWSGRLYGALLLYGLGLLLALVGFALRGGWNLKKIPRRFWNSLRAHCWEALALAVILAVALFLRLYRLDYYPPPGGISWIDEAQVGKEAHAILTSDYRHWEFPVLIYSVALAFRLWGEKILVLRLVPIFYGWLTLVAFYFLARLWFGVGPALAATFLFSFSRWHIALTKIAQPWMTSMLLMVIAFFCLLWGLRYRGRMAFVWAGLALALSMYSLAATNLIFIAFILILLLGRIVGAARQAPVGERRAAVAAWFKEHGPGLLILLLALLLYILPYISLVRRDPLLLTERFISVMPSITSPGVEQAPQIWQNFKRVLLFFNFEGALWPGVNIPEYPMLDPLSGALFNLGLLYCLVYFWRNDHYFLLAWFLITLIGGGVLTNTLVSHRLANLIPAVYLFICALLAWAWQEYRRAMPGKAFYLLPPAVMVFGFSAWYNYDLFFNYQIHNDAVRAEFDYSEVGVANHIREMEKGYYIALFASYPFYGEDNDLNWVAGHPRGESFRLVSDAVPARMEPPSAVAYYVVPPYRGEELAGIVRKVYPGAIWENLYGEHAHYSFAVARVSEEEVLSRRGLTGRYWPAAQTAEAAVTRHEPGLSFDWLNSAPPLPLPFTAEWQGSIFIPQTGLYLITLRGPGQAEVYLDDVPMEEERLLAQGWHGFRALYHTGSSLQPLRLFRRGSDGILRLVSAADLSTLAGPQGLLARYYDGPHWEGEPLLQRIEGAAVWADLRSKPYSIQWAGQLLAPQSGSYHLQAIVRDGSMELALDGGLIMESAPGEQKQESIVEADVELAGGWHELRVRYSRNEARPRTPASGVMLYWTPPDSADKELVPPDHLRPALEE
jgi:hypothetical protein